MTAPALEALDGLREDLLFDLDYTAFLAELDEVRAVVARLPAARMELDCLKGAAGLAVGTFNEYVYAANAWADCLSDPSCALPANGPVIDRKWWVAGLFLDEAHAALAGS